MFHACIPKTTCGVFLPAPSSRNTTVGSYRPRPRKLGVPRTICSRNERKGSEQGNVRRLLPRLLVLLLRLLLQVLLRVPRVLHLLRLVVMRSGNSFRCANR